MIDAQNAAHAAAEAADLAVNNRVMSDGTMPGLEPSLALQRRVQQGTEADEAFNLWAERLGVLRPRRQPSGVLTRCGLVAKG